MVPNQAVASEGLHLGLGRLVPPQGGQRRRPVKPEADTPVALAERPPPQPTPGRFPKLLARPRQRAAARPAPPPPQVELAQELPGPGGRLLLEDLLQDGDRAVVRPGKERHQRPQFFSLE